MSSHSKRSTPRLILTPGEAALCALEPHQRARIEREEGARGRLRRAFQFAKRRRDGRVR